MSLIPRWPRSPAEGLDLFVFNGLFPVPETGRTSHPGLAETQLQFSCPLSAFRKYDPHNSESCHRQVLSGGKAGSQKHPLCSSDLPPCDPWLLLELKVIMKGEHFEWIQDMEAAQTSCNKRHSGKKTCRTSSKTVARAMGGES